MIRVCFLKRGCHLAGFDISGHAPVGPGGISVACAAVSSAVELTANAVTEQAKVPARVSVEDNRIRLVIPKGEETDVSEILLGAFQAHLQGLSEDFRGTIHITDTEV